MYFSSYLKIYPSSDSPDHLILYSTRRASVVRVPAKTLHLIKDGTLPEEDCKTLARLGFLVPDPAKERKELLTRFDEANRQGNRFSAIVVLNLDCNLACGYCFEEGVREKRAMSAETADHLVAMIEQEHLARGRKVSLDFYGGEPLLSIDLIRSISSRLRNAAATRQLLFEFTLVTNGTLLDRSLALELAALGMKSAKITLDGPRDTHNRARPFISGQGSFDTIIRNVREICDIVDLQLGGNFTRHNYREFPRLLDYISEVGITPEKLRMFSFNQVIGRIAGPAVPDFTSSCNCTDEEWLCEATLFLREETLKRGFPTPKPGPAGCMAEFRNELVINVDGAIYKCPAFIGQEGFAVGDLRSGIVSQGEQYNMDVWKKPECLECAYLPLCFGGCRYMKFLRDGTIDSVDCWKPYLDATLEGCVRQDLKYRPRKR